MKDVKNYTATDIERYHSGVLSATERHALEKAALDDPFLADALEGYAFTQTPAADVGGLEQRLQQRIEGEKKRRGLFYIGNNWMKIAALFVLIAGGGWLVAGLFSTDKTETLAGNKEVQKAPAVVTTEAAQDSVMVYTDAPAIVPSPSSPQPSAPQKEQAPERSGAAPPDAIARQKSKPDVMNIPPATFSTATADSARDQVYAARERSFSEAERKQDALFNKEAASNDKFKSSVPARLDTLRNFNVAMKRDTTGLSEVVVVGYGTARKKSTAAGRAQGLVMDTLEPANGWRYFDDYVASNLKEPVEVKAKGTRGEVELAFEVNKEGEPVNISVTKSLCEKCDEEAVRLLKEGPKWKKAKKKGRVKIKF